MEELIKEYAKRLKLSWIPRNYHQIQAETFEEYLLKLFENEVSSREERKINRLIKQASFPKIKDAKPFIWDDIQLPNDIDNSYLLDCVFVDKLENLIFYGGVGTGKTYLATIIGLNAAKQGKKVKFFTVAQLANKLMEANDKGNLEQCFKQVEKLDLLILDELGYIPLHKAAAELLFQVISLCYEKRSLIITTNLSFAQWNHVFVDQILTEAVIDRLIHHSHLLIFDGESHRYKESLMKI
ncbi:DNA replication protein DnaC [Desulfohalotomaculum tongense]|uniref:IS21-like element helper ATPase IstB n=1 Tax=Desulforadius tongensis TaxID=1216062 RepID=UPI00195799F4|nr:IS21-like element helper ATPase IstB [Desulforadius tongensis]MBM7856225.1 DNA replication protein DnaC [Desulforadius tongensis]